MIANTNRTFIINENKLIKRQQNNLDIYSIDDSGNVVGKREYTPIKTIDEIYILKKCIIDTETLAFLRDNNIVVHFFSRGQRHVGNFVPNGKNSVNKSGFVLLQQLRAFDDEKHRVYLAKQITKGHFLSMRENLRKYKIKNNITLKIKLLDKQNSIVEIMSLEGEVKKEYYSKWNDIIKDQANFSFTKRSRRPPADKINALISYLNARIYNICLCEIYKTELNPQIGFLHEPNFRSLSLHLDIAEIFKPILGDRLIFTLLNKKQITTSSFEKKDAIINIKKEAIKIIELELIKRLSETTIVNGMKYNLRGVILREVNKIKKSIVEFSEYIPYTEIKN